MSAALESEGSMRRLVFILALLGWLGVAHADDPRAEMSLALAAAIDAHPAPAALPGTTAATKVAATPAAKRIPPQANLGRAAAEHAHQAQDQANAAALAHQAQAASMAAAGLTQAQAAKTRAAHHPHP
jgi:hypothetical protein